MKWISGTFLALLTSSAFAQFGSTESFSYPYHTDSLQGKEDAGFRRFSIALPSNYEENGNYPVIYALDGEWMFEPTLAEVRMLTEFEVIPPSIVVGVYQHQRNNDLGLNWETGEFTDQSRVFYQFLVNDLRGYIDSAFATSGFNVLVGHSNSASFAAKVLTDGASNFRGVVALSQNLFGDQLKEYQNFLETDQNKSFYYYVASGYRDATPRLKSGLQLDSLFKLNENESVNNLHEVYNADHSGIAAVGLGNGIAYMFSDYQHYNDWDSELIAFLHLEEIGPVAFMNSHIEKMKEYYGIDFLINQDDLSLMQAMTRNDEEIEAVMKYELDHLGKWVEFYAVYAQFYEYAGSYEKALAYWNYNLEYRQGESFGFFYYRRPIQLLYYKMKDPERAIAWAIQNRDSSDRLTPYFNYWIARIASEAKVNEEEGLAAIESYITSYDGDKPIDLEKAKEIRADLMK